MRLYFDETIREKGEFIIGALVASDRDLTHLVHKIWQDEGLDPKTYEFKSSSPMHGNQRAISHRKLMTYLLADCQLALMVTPIGDRLVLGNYCAALFAQLLKSMLIPNGEHVLFVDQGIQIPVTEFEALGVTVHAEQNSITCGGLQVADHAAHILGSMLLEELGQLTKVVKVVEEECNDNDETINLGFELWASLRYSLFGILNPNRDPYDQLTHFRIVDGYGLLVAASCSPKLGEAAKRRFGEVYLGCIH